MHFDHHLSNDFNKELKGILEAEFQYLAGNVIDLKKISQDTKDEAEAFYKDFGFLENDNTHEPVTHLTKYQRIFWNWIKRYKYRLAVKSQKVGLSTSVLMENAMQAFLPPTNPLSTMGYQTLIISQNVKKAQEHISDLTKMIQASKMYSPFLIEKHEKGLLPTETSKALTILLRNPWKPTRPTAIIGVGSNPGMVWSFKRVKKVHMSDPAVISAVDDSELYDAAFSRLAITRGYFVIESPPRGQRGQLWEIYKASKLKISDDDPYKEQKEFGRFSVMEIPYTDAVEEGVTEESWFIAEMERMGPRFGQYYECKFMNPYNTWYDDSLFHYSSELQLGDQDT